MKGMHGDASEFDLERQSLSSRKMVAGDLERRN